MGPQQACAVTQSGCLEIQPERGSQPSARTGPPLIELLSLGRSMILSYQSLIGMLSKQFELFVSHVFSGAGDCSQFSIGTLGCFQKRIQASLVVGLLCVGSSLDSHLGISVAAAAVELDASPGGEATRAWSVDGPQVFVVDPTGRAASLLAT